MMDPNSPQPPHSYSPSPAEAPVVAQVVREPGGRPTAVRRSSGVMRLLLVLLTIALFLSLGVNLALMGSMLPSEAENRVTERHFSHERGGGKKVAILSVEGIISSGEGFFKQQIDHAREDAKAGRLKAIVLRVDSPGGTVTASDYMYHHLKKLREETGLPIVVSMGGIAASGGYYISMCVGDAPNTIYAEPCSFTGSIGVIMPHYDLAKLLADWGVKDDSVVSAELKGMGSLSRPMTEKERAIFQALVDDGFHRFKEIVGDGRPKFKKDPAELDRVATGQVFTSDQALAAGLIDRVGYLEDAVDRAIELANLDPKQTTVVRYKEEKGLLAALSGAQSRQPAFDLAALFDLSSPRAYYLCTRLPVSVQSGWSALPRPE